MDPIRPVEKLGFHHTRLREHWRTREAQIPEQFTTGTIRPLVSSGLFKTKISSVKKLQESPCMIQAGRSRGEAPSASATREECDGTWR